MLPLFWRSNANISCGNGRPFSFFRCNEQGSLCDRPEGGILCLSPICRPRSLFGTQINTGTVISSQASNCASHLRYNSFGDLALNFYQEKCRECLVILLYCATSVTPGFLAKGAFDFAFPHAINLAASAKKIEEKRIGRPKNGSVEFRVAEACSAGYLFCSEIMPTGHELRLMLINTLLKVNSRGSLGLSISDFS